MAIRWANLAQVFGAPAVSGWRTVAYNCTNSNATLTIQYMSNQPASLSRPGNLGTAYIGVWTGNRRDT